MHPKELIVRGYSRTVLLASGPLFRWSVSRCERIVRLAGR